jgi:hypothetical protein
MTRWEEIAWGAKDACDKAGEMITRRQEEIVRTACLDAYAAGVIAQDPGCDAKEIGEDTCTCRRCLMGQVERLREVEAWRLAVADALGYVNRAEGQSGCEIAEPGVIVAAFRDVDARAEAAEQRCGAAEKERDLALSLKRVAEEALSRRDRQYEEAEAELADELGVEPPPPTCTACEIEEAQPEIERPREEHDAGADCRYRRRDSAASCHCVRGPTSVVPSQSCPVHGWTPADRKASIYPAPVDGLCAKCRGGLEERHAEGETYWRCEACGFIHRAADPEAR